jgi:aminopeptidase N
MENASAIFYADRPFRDHTMGAGVIAHETAHQWFGDAVTEREWGHVWLSEGFASYWEKLWVQRFTSDSAFRDGMRQLRREIIESPVTAARPVLDTAETDYLKLLNTNSYQKGAWVLHMLRSELGDSAFFRGVRAYYTKHRHGTALTDDLRQELEAASGRPLGAFFDQWLRRPGVPRVQVTADYDVRAKRVVLRVEQEGTPYRFPLTVEVRDSDGRRRRATIDVPATASSRIAAPALGARRVGAGELVVDPDVTLLADVKTR